MTYTAFLLLTTAFAFGLRHGLDLDHLATIDAITRTLPSSRPLARFVGVLFSLGHGLVVMLMSLLIGSGLIQSHTPLWLNQVGDWISIFFLFLFGLISLWMVLRPTTKEASALPLGLMRMITRPLTHPNMPAYSIALIGALFAISFDTFSQVAFLSLSAHLLTNWGFSILLGTAFMLGMMTTDGLNGLVVSFLIQRANQFSMALSRLTGLTIAGFSLVIATINLIRITHA